MRIPAFPVLVTWAAVGWTGVISLRAQQALYVRDDKGTMRLVRKIEGTVPYFAGKGELVVPNPDTDELSTATYHFALGPADEFFPALVSLQNVEMDFPKLPDDSRHKPDLRFIFSAKISSDYALKNVFFVFEFDPPANSPPARTIWVKGVAAYELAESKTFTKTIYFVDDLPRTKVKVHVFSDGLEMFHSEMPRRFVAEQFAKMAAKRIAKAKDSTARPLTGPMPRYPEKMRKGKTVGRAVLTCVIAPDGQPTEVALKSATEPAFGEAALAVMAQWWFVPAVVNGQPVATKAELPFEFAPPKS